MPGGNDVVESLARCAHMAAGCWGADWSMEGRTDSPPTQY